MTVTSSAAASRVRVERGGSSADEADRGAPEEA